ncbi:MAG: hypothetical protein Ct9H300mP6_08510 [Gammaproteobacteria bacterium]|nr:MAG: hypothetical protein Ct9H300mP6_08510 [Gammaproteobacteria bacterium]
MKYGAKFLQFTTTCISPLLLRDLKEDYKKFLRVFSFGMWVVNARLKLRVRSRGFIPIFNPWETLKNFPKGQAMYAPFLDFKGGFINDPVMLKIDEDHFWFSFSGGDSLPMGQGGCCWNNFE